jgi:hypothetical protein
MRIHKIYIAVGLIIAFGLFFELMAHADETNEATRVTFSQAIQIPGQVLPAGTYIFQQADSNSDLDLVQIFSADRSVLYATLQTVSAERTVPTAKTTITLAEAKSGKPDLLVRWFYPGRLSGHEFVYSKEQEQEIAQARQQTFVGSQLMPNAEAAGE